MSLFKYFHSTNICEEDINREKAFLTNIKESVSKKCGISKFIEYDDFTVAFAGSMDNMELLLEITTQKCNGKKYMYASIDDEVSWQEWDFDNLADFEKNIVEYIVNRVNKTIKTVVEISKNEFRTISSYLDENGEWVCFEEESSNNRAFGFITSKTPKSTEIIKTYKLEI